MSYKHFVCCFQVFFVMKDCHFKRCEIWNEWFVKIIYENQWDATEEEEREELERNESKYLEGETATLQKGIKTNIFKKLETGIDK